MLRYYRKFFLILRDFQCVLKIFERNKVRIKTIAEELRRNLEKVPERFWEISKNKKILWTKGFLATFLVLQYNNRNFIEILLIFKMISWMFFRHFNEMLSKLSVNCEETSEKIWIRIILEQYWENFKEISKKLSKMIFFFRKTYLNATDFDNT